jgi:hypothetical protein
MENRKKRIAMFQKARMKAWAKECSRITGLGPFQLDMLNLWTSGAPKKKETPDLRKRIFEYAKKRGTTPRLMTKYLDAFDRDPALKQTRALYDAAIWHLLMDKNPVAEYVDGLVERLFTTYNLKRVDPIELDGAMELHDKIGHPELYQRCLKLALEDVDPIDKLALVWCLYLQTDDGVNWAIRERLLKTVDALLDVFFNHFYGYEEYLRFYTFAVRALQESHLKLGSRDRSFGNRQSSNSWIILPISSI